MGNLFYLCVLPESTFKIIDMSRKSIILVLKAAMLTAGAVQATAFVSTGSTVMLNGNAYYIPAQPVTSIHVSSSLLTSMPSVAGLTPVTVISTTSLTFNQANLDAVVANYTATDDVFQPEFLQGLLQLYYSYVVVLAFKLSSLDTPYAFRRSSSVITKIY